MTDVVDRLDIQRLFGPAPEARTLKGAQVSLFLSLYAGTTAVPKRITLRVVDVESRYKKLIEDPPALSEE